MFETTLLSLCIKLYLLNVLQYSKLRPFCFINNRTFPFITLIPTTSTNLFSLSVSTSTTRITPTATSSNAMLSTSSFPTTESSVTTIPTLVTQTTISNLDPIITTSLIPITTVNSVPVTNTGIITTTSNNAIITTTPNTAIITTTPDTDIITTTFTTNPTTTITNERQKKSPVLTKDENSNQKEKSNCPTIIEYCLSDGKEPTLNCPCFDIRTGMIKKEQIKRRICVGPDKYIGTCTSLEECPFMVEDYYSILNKWPNLSFIEFLRLSKCRKTTDQICCRIKN